jgi:hypothetical protein
MSDGTQETIERVQRLRELAASDPLDAQDAAWAWLARTGELAARHGAAASTRFEQLFAVGEAPRAIDGRMGGQMLMTCFGDLLDRPLRKIGTLWMPWLGKRFDASAQRGCNSVSPGFRVVSAMLWPGYRLRRDASGVSGFDFATRVEAGGVAPAVDVLVIDYAAPAENPQHLVPRIRDELVEIVPGVYLGRALWRGRSGAWRNLGYFMLRPATR